MSLRGRVPPGRINQPSMGYRVEPEPECPLCGSKETDMEKRAVVNTEKEKTAHQKVKIDQSNVTTQRTQTQKPNESAKPRSEGK